MITTNDAFKGKPQILTELFMRAMSGRQANQSVPVAPIFRDDAVRNLRANLMFEETMETIEIGLGMEMNVSALRAILDRAETGGERTISLRGQKDLWSQVKPVSLIELAGNLADIDVVGPCGTAESFGIAHRPIMGLICGNNLLKFAPGHAYRADGKLLKPENHPKPERAIALHLITQGADQSVIESDFRRVTGEAL